MKNVQPAGDHDHANKGSSGDNLSALIKKQKRFKWVNDECWPDLNKRTSHLLLVGMKAAAVHTSMTQQFCFHPREIPTDVPGASSGIAIKQKQPQCPSGVEGISKLWCVQTNERLCRENDFTLSYLCVKTDISQNHNAE